MAQNNYQHYSNLAEYTKFLPRNSSWPESIDNVQAALALIGSWARTDVGLPVSSETIPGVVSGATQDEVTAGIITNKYVSPATLKSSVTRPDASETVKGLTQYATNAEALAGTLKTKTIVPSSLKYVLDNTAASETKSGLIKLATSSMGNSATDNTTACSPKRVKEMILFHSANPPSYSAATESNQGLVTIATQAQVAAGVIHDGYAVTPKTFIGTKASTSSFGVIKVASTGEVSAGTADNVAVSPRGLQSLKAGDNIFGLVKLGSSGTNDTQVAARARDTVFTYRKIQNKNLANDIWLTPDDIGSYSKQESDNRYMPSNRIIGNITRIEGTNGNRAANEWWECRSPWEGYSKASFNLNVKFDKNNDGGDFRKLVFEIWDRERNINWGQYSVTLENYKGGRNGHSWRFEAFGTQLLEFPNIPPGTAVQFRPVDINKAMWYNIQMIFATQ